MDEVHVTFNGKDGAVKASAVLEIADTDETRAKGLSKRASLDDGHGMFFDRAGVYWMKDVEFPLDLAFLSKEGEVVEIQQMPVDKNGVFHYSPAVENRTKVAHAVEMPFGFMQEHEITPGDTMFVVIGG